MTVRCIPLSHFSEATAEVDTQTDDVTTLRLEGVTESESRLTQSAEDSAQKDDEDAMTQLSARGSASSNLNRLNKFVSTPDLRAHLPHAAAAEENVQVLYGSLMRLNNDDVDSELLLGSRQHVSNTRRLRAQLTGMTNKASARLSQFMTKSTSVTSPQSKYATLPVVHEDSPTSPRFAVPYSPEADDSAFQDSVDTSQQDSNIDDDSFRDDDVTRRSSDCDDSRRLASYSSQMSSGEPATRAETVIGPDVPVSLLNSTILSKSSLVVSGGEGHLNWNVPRNPALSPTDLCLLLWQHRQ